MASTSTRERLVAAAIEVFREHGYERARVQDIARAAGLTTGATACRLQQRFMQVEVWERMGVDAADGWLREKFTESGVIQFEDWTDTGAEYEILDELSRDRDGATEAATA